MSPSFLVFLRYIWYTFCVIWMTFKYDVWPYVVSVGHWFCVHQSPVVAIAALAFAGVWAFRVMWEMWGQSLELRALWLYINDTRNILLQHAKQIDGWKKREEDGHALGHELIQKLEETGQIVEIQVGKLKNGLQVHFDATLKSFHEEILRTRAEFKQECMDAINRERAELKLEVSAMIDDAIKAEFKKRTPERKSRTSIKKV